MHRLSLLFLTALALLAQPKVEVGELNGAQFRIDVPAQWNGGLIMYCHGYSAAPGKFSASSDYPLAAGFTGMGYAVAQSGYSSGGWAIQEAVTDTESLRRYFVLKYGAARETYVMGHSMGGFLTMVLMESYPNVYDGGLPMCGPLAPASLFMEKQPFDMVVLFGYFFPGALPEPVAIPDTFSSGQSKTIEVMKLLEAEPAKSELLRRYFNLKTNKEMAGTVVFFASILQELQKRFGGNAFDNRDTIYSGLGDDNAVNRGVKRYSADAAAAAGLARFYTPTGRISRPMLHLHTTYDPLVPAWVPNLYSELAQQAGSGALFAQQSILRDGHCSILSAEIRSGFDQLRAWKNGGPRPVPGAVPVP